jgi:hypothetical protein
LRSDPIQAPQWAAPPSIAHVQRNDISSSWSSKVQWSSRWDQQHDSMVLMVESICGQGFAYASEVEEDWQKI